MSEKWNENQAPEKIDYRRYLDIVRRRHLLFLAGLLAGWLLIWGGSWLIHPKFKSSTLILIQQQGISKEYVSPNVNDNMQGLLQSITPQILSRTRLLTIINRFHLYAGGEPALTPDEKVDRMRKDISVDLVQDQRSGLITAFRVSFVGSNPQLAQSVTGELTKLFIGENTSARERQAVETTQFIHRQLLAARATLTEQDANVRAFQAAHQGELPSQQASNLQILSGLQSQLQSEEGALNAAKQQSVYNQSLMAQYRSMPKNGQQAVGSSPELAAIDQQLNALQSKLAALTARYTARYPGVEDLKQEIAKTQQARQELVAQLNTAGRGASSGERKTAANPGNGESQPMLQLSSQLQANKSEIADLERSVASLKARINDYQSRLNAQPIVEQQLANLTRGYQQSQANYDDLLKKENESQMATSMEQMQGGQRFAVLDPPSLPLRPYSPDRRKAWAGGLGGGIGLGLLLVGVVEKVDDRLYTDEDIEKLLSVGVLAEIPEITNAEDERRTRRRAFISWVTATVVCLTILVGAVITYVHA